MIKMITDPWDRQQDESYTYCALCGGEIYYGEKCFRAGEKHYHEECITEEVAGE